MNAFNINARYVNVIDRWRSINCIPGIPTARLGILNFLKQ